MSHLHPSTPTTLPILYYIQAGPCWSTCGVIGTHCQWTRWFCWPLTQPVGWPIWNRKIVFIGESPCGNHGSFSTSSSLVVNVTTTTTVDVHMLQLWDDLGGLSILVHVFMSGLILGQHLGGDFVSLIARLEGYIYTCIRSCKALLHGVFNIPYFETRLLFFDDIFFYSKSGIVVNISFCCY